MNVIPEEYILPIYNIEEHSAPGCMRVSEHNNTAVDQAIYKHNLLWVATYHVDRENEAVPGWTGFNIKMHSETEFESNNISYLSSINAPVTVMATATEILNILKS